MLEVESGISPEQTMEALLRSVETKTRINQTGIFTVVLEKVSLNLFFHHVSKTCGQNVIQLFVNEGGGVFRTIQEKMHGGNIGVLDCTEFPGADLQKLFFNLNHARDNFLTLGNKIVLIVLSPAQVSLFTSTAPDFANKFQPHWI